MAPQNTDLEAREIELIGRDGIMRPFNRSEIYDRIEGFLDNTQGIDVDVLCDKVIESLPGHTTTADIDYILAQIAHDMYVKNPDYDVVAARVFISNLHRLTPSSFSEAMRKQYNKNFNPTTGECAPLISEEAARFVRTNSFVLDKMIDARNDFQYGYTGARVLYDKYLTHIHDENGARVICDRPQYVWMRVAIVASRLNIGKVEYFYRAMADRKMSVATPVAINACRPNQFMSSCFLVTMGDGIREMFDDYKTMALLSKHGGGVGITFDNVRSEGAYIAGTGGQSNGVVPFIKVAAIVAETVDQGGNHRSGSFAMYLSVHHPDILKFIQMQTNGKDLTLGLSSDEAVSKIHSIFPGVWIPDLFMKRVMMPGGKWSLFDPRRCPGLQDVYDAHDEAAYTALYEKYEREGKAARVMEALDLWKAMIRVCMETNRLYFCSKDNANDMSNQVYPGGNGIIMLSNLCTEIFEVTRVGEIANCNLASLILPQFLMADSGEVDWRELMHVAGIATELLNAVIDHNMYVGRETRVNNMLMRPIAIGVQGLANMLIAMPGHTHYTSEASQDAFALVAEAIYLGALRKSAQLAQIYGPYPGYEDDKCPYSRGIFMPEMYERRTGTKVVLQLPETEWDVVRDLVLEHGVYNSLVTAMMPTAQTSLINNYEAAFEPFLTKRYTKKTSIGDLMIVNEYFIREMVERSLWTEAAIAEFGEVTFISEMKCVPEDLKLKYMSAYEVDQYDMIDMIARVQPFVDQGISFNRYGITGKLTGEDLSNMIFYAWKKGLKTLQYYLKLIQVDERAVAYTAGAEAGMKKWQQISGSGSDSVESGEGGEIKIINGKKIICTDEVCTSCSA